MLKRIIHPSTALVEFLLMLQLQLSRPQQRHVLRLVEAVIVGEGRKTLAELYRLWVDAPDVSAASDFLRVSPWDDRHNERQVQVFIIQDLLTQARARGQAVVLWVSLDDSTHYKDKSTVALDGVDWVHDHAERRVSKHRKGLAEVSLHVQMGDIGYRFAFRVYVRQQTVRRLNRQRLEDEDRLAFKTKYRLAREMLEELRELLPLNVRVYVLCDSWYTSAKLIKYCHRQGWYVIGALKPNRRLNGHRLDAFDRSLWHTRYTKVRVADRTYWVRVVTGRLKELPFEVGVVISRRHPGDKSPKYFLCSDLSLDAQAILAGYSRRWSIEVDYFDLKQYLGASDWRVQSLRATRRWWWVVHLALVFLQWRSRASPDTRQRSIPDLIRQQRADHAREILVAACEQVLQTGALEPVLERFIAA
jgi:hypothetical protein